MPPGLRDRRAKLMGFSNSPQTEPEYARQYDDLYETYEGFVC
jgi:hypothetical protein